LYDKHKNKQVEINTLKCQLNNKWLEKTIEAFHKIVHTIEVDQQLQGIRPANILTPPTIKYELEERATVARLLFESFNGQTEDQILEVRIELVKNLVQLCRRQETPHQYKASQSRRLSKTSYLDSGTDVEDDIFGGDIGGESIRDS
jgi:hypothetical protein